MLTQTQLIGAGPIHCVQGKSVGEIINILLQANSCLWLIHIHMGLAFSSSTHPF